MPLTFHHSGGNVLWKGRHPLKDHQVFSLAESLWDECIGAREAGDGSALAIAEDLNAQLLEAYTQAKRWRKCAGASYVR